MKREQKETKRDQKKIKTTRKEKTARETGIFLPAPFYEAIFDICSPRSTQNCCGISDLAQIIHPETLQSSCQKFVIC